MNSITFDSVFKQYSGGHEALKDISFHLEKSSMTFLTGHSGAGKSTLLKSILLVERISRGKILINDSDISNMPVKKVPYHRRNIGVVFQDHKLLMDKTVFDNVALPLKIHGFTKKIIESRVDAALERVGLLDRKKSYPITLSSGEQQRVGIARAVVHKPDILLADEPTGNLDPELSAEVMKLFQQFNTFGVTVLIATHDIALIEAMQLPRLVLAQGRLVSTSNCALEIEKPEEQLKNKADDK